MSDNQLDPSVEEFKAFVRRHPKLVSQVKEQGESWQPYYEKWVLLGEEDSFWNSYREDGGSVRSKKGETEVNQKQSTNSDENQEFMGQLMGIVEKVDLNKVQEHIQQLNGAVQNIQSLIGQFQDMKKQLPGQTQTQNRAQRKSPFSFGRD